MVFGQSRGHVVDRGLLIVRESLLKSYLRRGPTRACQFNAALLTRPKSMPSTGLPIEARATDLWKAATARVDSSYPCPNTPDLQHPYGISQNPAARRRVATNPNAYFDRRSRNRETGTDVVPSTRSRPLVDRGRL